MKKVLAENKHGHGARPKSRIAHKVTRFFRPTVAGATRPFDWTAGYHTTSKFPVNIKDQGQSDSCGGQAGSYFIGVARSIFYNIPYKEQSAKSIYAPIAYPGGGTTVSSLENYISKDGANDETEVSSYIDRQLPTEEYMTDLTWRTTDMMRTALTKAGFIPLSVALNMESFAQAIRDYGGLIMQIDAKNNGSWESFNPKPPVSGNINPLWSHFMCGEGADNKPGENAVYFFQSWGEAVGNKGIQYFTKDYFDSGYIVDAFTFQAPLPTPIPPPITTVRDLSRGDSGQDVLQLQKLLSMPIYYQTGYFGYFTWAYLVWWQYSHGLSYNGGVYDTATRLKLTA